MNDMKRQLDQLEERYKGQQPPAQEGGRKSVLGSIIASRKFAPAPNKGNPPRSCRARNCAAH
jgi:hypothetical protein